jgi:hypothetical protein
MKDPVDTFYWKIDHSYKNTGSKRNIQDEFIRKVWVDKDHDRPLRSRDWTIYNSGGIRGLAIGRNGVKDARSIDKSAIFCITTKHSTGSHNPWEDYIDHFNGQINYWGDAKYRVGYDLDDFKGNKMMVHVFNKVLERKLDEIPPIFYFINNTQGIVEFKGLCVLENLEKRWFIDEGKRIKNYYFTLGIIDTEKVKPEWIKHRAINNNDDHDACPLEWKKYIRNGDYNRLQAWKNSIKSKEIQLPVIGSKEDLFLKRLRKIDPFDFEKIVVQVLQKSKITHTITQTRNVKDKGFDMEGHFELPSPLNYEIFFKGEVKRQKGGIGPEKVSRLVARLNRGEYGLFFTTSYYTKQAQEEVIKDGYPVKLFSGVDLYNLFESIGMTIDGELQ